MRTIRFAAPGLMVAALGLAACGGGESQTDATAGVPEDVLIKTHLTFSESGEGSGDVVSGSVIGNEPFCEGGTFSDAYPGQVGDVEKTLDCVDGTLEIRFTPKGQSKKQSGPWTVEGATGAYEGVTGEGEMSVTFENRDEGAETFRGTLTR